MDPIIAAASVIAASLAVGLAAVGPGLVRVTLLVVQLMVLLVNLRQKVKSVVHFFLVSHLWSPLQFMVS